MKQNQAELYLETYQVLDLEMSRLRDIQRWQASASSKVYSRFFLLFLLKFVFYFFSLLLEWCLVFPYEPGLQPVELI